MHLIKADALSFIGKIVGALLGLPVVSQTLGLAFISLIVGHMFDQASVAGRAALGPRRGSPLEIGERFFTATFEVMGHVAKADGRVSEAEIAAARKVMAELRLTGVQIHAAIAHFTRGKSPDFNLRADDGANLPRRWAQRPDLLRIFLELQVRAALEGVDMQGPARLAVQRVGDLLAMSRIELAHMEPVLRIRREQFQGRRGGNGGRAARLPSAAPRHAAGAAYQILEVDPKATNEEVAKAYRRQLSKHHPDKLKANGLPESSNTPNNVRSRSSRRTSSSSRHGARKLRPCRHPGSRLPSSPRISRGSAPRSSGARRRAPT